MSKIKFTEVYNQHSWKDVHNKIYSSTKEDVEKALNKTGRLELPDFFALLSPAASNYLDEMAVTSKALTKKRFGNTLQLFIPLYLSNECQNICTYCGFSLNNKIPRIVLNQEQVLQEIEFIKAWGFEHVLLVTGESHKVGIKYFEEMLKLTRKHFSHVSIEVQPLEKSEYQKLVNLGLDAVLLYQETYNQDSYKKHHLKGKKANFFNRLEAPELIAQTGIDKIGLGVLLGLSDFRVDAWFAALHLFFLKKHYWKTRYSLAFPRLQSAEGVQINDFSSSEKDLIQLILAFRILDESLELSLSTRESPEFRRLSLELGITTMSAGSKTNPGGYFSSKDELEQFSTTDESSPKEVEKMIIEAGLEPVWKDWHTFIS